MFEMLIDEEPTTDVGQQMPCYTISVPLSLKAQVSLKDIAKSHFRTKSML